MDDDFQKILSGGVSAALTSAVWVKYVGKLNELLNEQKQQIEKLIEKLENKTDQYAEAQADARSEKMMRKELTKQLNEIKDKNLELQRRIEEAGQ